MKKIFIWKVVLLLVGGVILGWLIFDSGTSEPIACTDEAKICPDGTAVGRVGTDCKFADCPLAKYATTTARLSQQVSVLGMAITPLEVLQDSRCAVDVVCIWAGKVELLIKLEKDGQVQEATSTPSTLIEFSGRQIELIEVGPVPYSTKQIQPEDYLFTFSVKLK